MLGVEGEGGRCVDGRVWMGVCGWACVDDLLVMFCWCVSWFLTSGFFLFFLFIILFLFLFFVSLCLVGSREGVGEVCVCVCVCVTTVSSQLLRFLIL